MYIKKALFCLEQDYDFEEKIISPFNEVVYVIQCMSLHDEGRLCGEMASMAKYWATDLENKVGWIRIGTGCLQPSLPS